MLWLMRKVNQEVNCIFYESCNWLSVFSHTFIYENVYAFLSPLYIPKRYLLLFFLFPRTSYVFSTCLMWDF